jgi:nucleotide-binding universal stress UspA family protein
MFITPGRPCVSVAVNGTPESEAAAHFAVREATIRGARFRVAHAYQPRAGRGAAPRSTAAERADQGQRVVDATVALLRVPAAMQVETHLVDTDPYDLVTGMEASSDLIVIGHSSIADGNRPPMRRLINHVTAHATCAMAVVPRTWHDPKRRLPILVAIDGETAAGHALGWAFDEAVMRGTELHVVHVLRPGASAVELGRRQRNVAEVLASWRADYPDLVLQALITQGDPTQMLVQCARSAALMVVGHPHTALPAPWFRSLARSLIAAAPVPLIVVPESSRVMARRQVPALAVAAHPPAA